MGTILDDGPTTLMVIVCKQRGTWEAGKDRLLALREKCVAAGMLP